MTGKERAMTKSTLDRVREFHEAYGLPVAHEPKIADEKVNGLRVELLREELEELTVALKDRDLTEVLDALTDLQYVLDGAYLSFGLHSLKEKAFAEVHRANMSKLGADGKPVVRESDGKILKGPNYTPPDIKSIVEGWLRGLKKVA
jgi:predicted HAD superfamily Cof-like phosphohydrolase